MVNGGPRGVSVSGMTGIMAYNYLSRWSGTLGVCAIVAIIRPAHAEPRAVVELFTSQGCSSCPPADQIIGELAKDPSVIALSLPIDYWIILAGKIRWRIRASAPVRRPIPICAASARFTRRKLSSTGPLT